MCKPSTTKKSEHVPETETTNIKFEQILLKNLRSSAMAKTDNYLNKFRLSDLFKWRISTCITILFSFVSLVKANSTSIAPTVEAVEYQYDLVICLPLNSNSCITYVNTLANGLIELNETKYPGLKAFKGSYDYKIIARTNPLWLKFEPPSDTTYFVMGFLHLIIFIFGVSGNGLVIYMFVRSKALRTSSNIFIFNLAISDIMIVIKCPMASYNNFMKGPALGDWGCRIFGFVGGLSGLASIGMLTVTAMDRFSVVVNPLSSSRLNCKKYYYHVVVAIVWLESLFFSIIPLCEIGLSTYVPEGYLTTCSFDYLNKSINARIFMFVFFLFAWLVPLVIICYCYYYILKVVFTSKAIQSNKNHHQIEVRLSLIVLLVIGLWFLAWTPYALVAMAGVFGQEEYLTPTKSMIPAIFCKTASCFNPFLYTISNKRFRNELKRLFCKRQPINRYSMTKSTRITRSTRKTSHKVVLHLASDAKIDGVYEMELNSHRKLIRSKLSTETTEVGSHAVKLHTNINADMQSTRSSPDHNGVCIIDINMVEADCCRQEELLETDF